MPSCWSKQSCLRELSSGDARPVLWEEVDMSMWCVTAADLKELRSIVKEHIKTGKIKPPLPDDPHYKAEYDGVPLEKWDPTVYKVMDELIKPQLMEMPNRTSWALNKHPDGLKCDVFATHAWAEGIFEFIDAALESFPWPTEHMYVCFLSNPQDETSLQDIFLRGPHASPFAMALESAKFFVVIPTRRVCIYKRLWCVYEMYCAYTRIVETGDLKIKMRWLTSKWTAVVQAGCSLLAVPLPVCLVTFFLICPHVPRILGPLMWLMMFHLSGSVVWFLIHLLSDKCLKRQHPHAIPACELWLMQVWTYARVALFGVGVGFALHELVLYRAKEFSVAQKCTTDTDVLWEHGETAACAILFSSFLLMYACDMLTTVYAEIVHREGGKLDHFTTVSEAVCINAEDTRSILGIIGEKIDEIDEVISDIRVLGKYDDDVLFNLRLGMHRDIIRQGINPAQLICGFVAWEFWVLTDLYARGYLLAFLIPVATSSIALLVVYGPSTYKFHAFLPNEKFIFAIQSFMWVGIAYAVLSNYSEFFTCFAVKHYTMTISSLPLLLAMAGVWVLLCLFYYCGLFARCKRSFSGGSVYDLEVDLNQPKYSGMRLSSYSPLPVGDDAA